MADLMGTATESLGGIVPTLGEGSFIFKVIMWALIVLIIVGVIGLLFWLFLRWTKYKYLIRIFEKVNGQWELARKDRAMEVKFSTAGDTIFHLRKAKKYIPTPSFQSGRRTFWMFKREDGELINFRMGDLDELQKTMGAKFLDKEMRFARTQIHKGLKDRYDAPGFWKQYGLLVISIVYLTILGVMVYISLGQFIRIIGNSATVIDAGGEVVKEVERLLSMMNNVCTGGTGYVPAG